MKFIIQVVLVGCVFASLISSVEAGWLVYHEPEFKGTVSDIESKQPIEGAVVVAIYRKATMGLGAGSISSIINVRETLTDKEGRFRIPSYTTLIQPFSWQIPNHVIIYKPGYANVEIIGRWPFEKEIQEQERPCAWTLALNCKYRGHGIIEIPILRTKEERLREMPSPVGEESDYKKQKLFIRIINEERKNLGLRGEYTVEGGR